MLNFSGRITTGASAATWQLALLHFTYRNIYFPEEQKTLKTIQVNGSAVLKAWTAKDMSEFDDTQNDKIFALAEEIRWCDKNIR